MLLSLWMRTQGLGEATNAAASVVEQGIGLRHPHRNTPHPTPRHYSTSGHIPCGWGGEAFIMATLHQGALIFVFVLAGNGTRWDQIKRLLFFSQFEA